MESVLMTKLEGLNLVDRFLFDETMEDREAYQAAVSILLENEIELLERPETEKELRISPELRQIRLDVVSMDKEKRLYYTEMQQKDTKNLQKRSRYYQAQMDVSLLEPGSRDFNRLNDSCFILVAPFDIFGRGLYRYTFEGVCRECPDLKLEDGAVRIFINTKGKNREEFSKEFLDFMEYITNTTDEAAQRTESSKIKRIHQKVKQIRKSEKMGVKSMQRWEELAESREEGIKEGVKAGRTQGKEEKLVQLVCRKLRKKKSVEEIAEDLEEETEVIEKIFNVAEHFAPYYEEEKVYDRLRQADEFLA